jgi:flagellar assembly protein FliH
MSTVIKAGQPTIKPMRRLETIDLADHVVEAGKIISAARREATRLLTDANAAAGRIRKDAEQRGYQEGRARGESEGQVAGREQALREASDRFAAEQADLSKAMRSIVDELEALKRDLLIEAQRDVLMFAVHVARKVAKRAVAVDPHVAVENLKESLRLVGRKTDLVVHIHPSDGEAMRRFAHDVAGEVGNKQHLRIIENESIAPGGCRIATDTTEVDATVDTQIDQIAALVLSRTAGQGE